MTELNEFIEETKADVPQGRLHGRDWLVEHGCGGDGEYIECAAMSEDYRRLAREHATMLATIETAQKLGRYLDDAYEEATS